MSMSSYSPRKLASRPRSLLAGLLLALLLVPTALSVHVLDHQFSQNADDCLLCLASPQLDHAAQTSVLVAVQASSPVMATVSIADVADATPVALPPARAPPLA